ncbi:MAG TPA: NAD/NADP octopine/nopaline dehydrogenase family protein [Fibrobacteria bacterium]|nr:NAD/NADP octopine/nopaline dehydrogenase family protein [Fibrobacteria bacterium]
MGSRRLKVCICGGGNLAHAFLAVLGNERLAQVRLLSRKPERWSRQVKLFYEQRGVLAGDISVISDDPAETVSGSDLVIFALPAFAHREVMEKIKPFLRSDAWIGAMPGTAGFGWLAREILGRSHKVFVSERAPYVCRILCYGDSVHVSGIRDKVLVGAETGAAEISRLLGRLFRIRSIPVNGFLPIYLSPGNSIFHSSRLFNLFGKWRKGQGFPRETLFYEDWNDEAAALYLECDKDLAMLRKTISGDYRAVQTIKQHYKVSNERALAQRIRGINALRGILAPMVKTSGGYVPDFAHRFFREDAVLGLGFIRKISENSDVHTPTIGRIHKWAVKMSGLSGQPREIGFSDRVFDFGC